MAPQRAATSTATAPAATSPVKRVHPYHQEVGEVQPPLKVRFLEPEKKPDRPSKEPMAKVPRVTRGAVRNVMATLQLIKDERNRQLAICRAITAENSDKAREAGGLRGTRQ